MYETLEHWKQYKQEKELQNKIAQEYGLDKAMLKEVEKEQALEEFDEWMNDLIKRNGTTEY